MTSSNYLKMKAKEAKLPLEALRYWLSYDPLTGTFVWSHPTSNRAPKGSTAGHLHRSGYMEIRSRSSTHYSYRGPHTKPIGSHGSIAIPTGHLVVELWLLKKSTISIAYHTITG